MNQDGQFSPLSPAIAVLHDYEKERIDRLLYHVESNDYFAMLSTVLGFIEEALLERTITPEAELKLIRQMRSELAYLHEHFTIVKKESAS